MGITVGARCAMQQKVGDRAKGNGGKSDTVFERCAMCCGDVWVRLL